MTSILTGWRDDDRDEEEEQVEVKSTGQGEKNPTVRKGVIKKIHVLIFLITLSVTKILHLKKSCISPFCQKGTATLKNNSRDLSSSDCH